MGRSVAGSVFCWLFSRQRWQSNPNLRPNIDDTKLEPNGYPHDLVQFHRNLARSLLRRKRTEKEQKTEHAPRASEPQPATRGRGRGAEQPRPLISKNAFVQAVTARTGKKLRLSPQTTANLSEVVSSLRDSVWKRPTKNKENRKRYRYLQNT